MNTFELQQNDALLQLRLHADVTIEQARPLHEALVNQLPLARSVRVDAAAVTSVHPAILQVLLAVAVKAPLSVSIASDSWRAALQRLGLEDTILAPLASVSAPAS